MAESIIGLKQIHTAQKKVNYLTALLTEQHERASLYRIRSSFIKTEHNYTTEIDFRCQVCRNYAKQFGEVKHPVSETECWKIHLMRISVKWNNYP